MDGLLTGLHEPEASHLDMLSAYEPAVAAGYLWHEFMVRDLDRSVDPVLRGAVRFSGGPAGRI